MTSAFSPDGSEPLGRKLTKRRLRPDSISISDFYRLNEVSDFLTGHEGYVALQLGDSMLSDGCKIIRELNSLTNRDNRINFCIVADSTFGDGDVDEERKIRAD